MLAGLAVLTVQKHHGNHGDPEKGAGPVGGIDHGQHDGHDEDNYHRNDAPNDSRGQVTAGGEMKSTLKIPINGKFPGSN